MDVNDNMVKKSSQQKIQEACDMIAFGLKEGIARGLREAKKIPCVLCGHQERL